MTRDEAATIIREIQQAKPAPGTLLYRSMEAISFLLEEVDELENDLAFAEDRAD